MANLYDPSKLGINAPSGGFQQGGWYQGRQYWDGKLGDPGVLVNPNAVGAGQLVSKEVNLQSDAAQGNQPGDIEKYLEAQRKKQSQMNVQPTGYAGTRTQSTGTQSLPGGSGSMPEMAQPETINLQEQYKTLYEGSGITELQDQLSNYANEFAKQRAIINDNPFLSEATRVGRIEKLNKQYQDRTKNLQNELATKKADIETQLNLQLKQFDINSQAAQQSLSRFNALLEMGALDNASGEDIANITRNTGISSSMIANAIKAKKQSNVQPKIITSTDNAGNVTFTTVDANSGQIINQTSAGRVGKAKVSGASEKISDAEVQREFMFQLIDDIRSGQGVRDVFATYSGLIDPNDIIYTYNAISDYGIAKETPEELAKLGVNVDKYNYQDF